MKSKLSAVIKSKLPLLVMFPLLVFGISRVNVDQEFRDDWVPIAMEQVVGQTFVAKYDNLYRIDLFVKNPDLANKKDLIFHLREFPDSNYDLAKVGLSGFNAGYDTYLRIQFTPILRSAGKSFYFFLEAPQSGFGEAVKAGSSKKDILRGGNMFINHKPVEGDLFFITSYRSSPNDVISSFWEHFTKDGVFVLGYVSSLVLLLLILIIKNR